MAQFVSAGPLVVVDEEEVVLGESRVRGQGSGVGARPGCSLLYGPGPRTCRELPARAPPVLGTPAEQLQLWRGTQ